MRTIEIRPIFYVYVMFRPNGLPCYIGKGHGNRWLDFKKGRNINLLRIIKKNDGALPSIKIRENLTEAEAHETEIAFIKAIGRKAHGGPLVNFTDGGEGVKGFKHSAETRAKIKAAVAGKIRPPCMESTKKKIADAQRGKKRGPNPEHSARLMGRKLSSEHRAKIGVAHLGQKRSDEARCNMSVAQRGHTTSDEARFKMSISHIGKKQGAETIEKRISPLRGKVRDPSIAAKVSAAQKGKPKNAESVAKMIATMRSPEVLAKTSGANHWRARRRALA